MKCPKFQSIEGTYDILPEDQKYFQKIHDVAKEMLGFYGFGKINTPVLETTELFSKISSKDADIIKKKICFVQIKGVGEVILRQKGIISMAGFFIRNEMFKLPKPVKLWHFESFFCRKNVKTGGLKQTHQLGCGIFGEIGPVIDAQIIQIFYYILDRLKFKNLIIEINSIGCRQCKPNYRKVLIAYLKKNQMFLCSNCKRNFQKSPISVLMCKNKECLEIIKKAPQIIDLLCSECNTHFKELLEFLDELELPYSLNPFLAREPSYYTKTVFEIFENKPEGDVFTKNILAEGGRQDYLIKILRGKDIPICRATLDVEKIAPLIKEKAIKHSNIPAKKVFLAQLGILAKRKSLKLFQKFEEAKIPLVESFKCDSLETQLKSADYVKATYTLILGQKEALEGTIIIRDMKTGKQKTVLADNVVDEIKKRLKQKTTLQ